MTHNSISVSDTNDRSRNKLQKYQLLFGTKENIAWCDIPESKPHMAAWIFLKAINENKMDMPETAPRMAKAILKRTPLPLCSIEYCSKFNAVEREAYVVCVATFSAFIWQVTTE